MQMKEMLISVTGSQQGENGPDTMELITAGQYGYSSEEIVMSWQESEISGMEGTKTTLSVKNGRVVLTREGMLNSQMEFEEGKKNYFLYETPFGSATMGVCTRSIRSDLGTRGGNIFIDYTLDMDQTFLGRNKFLIRVNEPKKKHTGDIQWQI